MEDKLKNLLTNWLPGAVVTPSMLAAQGVSRQLANKYVRAGWLKSIGHGAVARTGDFTTWAGGLQAMQSQLELPIWAGGATALSIRGITHFVPMGRDRLWLFGAPRSKPPKWFANYDWGVNQHFLAPKLFNEAAPSHLDTRTVDGVSVQISSMERAALELLYLVPAQLEFEEASELMMGLSLLNSDRMQDLIQCCNLIRVKRLFFYFADYHQLPVLNRLKVGEFDLGGGTRQIVAGGRVDKKWNITVPEAFDRGAG